MRRTRSATRRRVIAALVVVLTLGLSYVITVNAAAQAQAAPIASVVKDAAPKHLTVPKQAISAPIVAHAPSGPYVTRGKTCIASNGINRVQTTGYFYWNTTGGFAVFPLAMTATFQRYDGTNWVNSDWASAMRMYATGSWEIGPINPGTSEHRHTSYVGGTAPSSISVSASGGSGSTYRSVVCTVQSG